ncbi:MAG TPA: hypothetical protein DEP46_19455 [Blastocatellia bacterium]|nr:hypothetical protein [Blastocatellia bacterium]
MVLRLFRNRIGKVPSNILLTENMNALDTAGAGIEVKNILERSRRMLFVLVACVLALLRLFAF